MGTAHNNIQASEVNIWCELKLYIHVRVCMDEYFVWNSRMNLIAGGEGKLLALCHSVCFKIYLTSWAGLCKNN